MKGRITYIKREREMNFPSIRSLPKLPLWLKLKIKVRSQKLDPGRDPGTWAIFQVFPGILAGGQIESRTAGS